MESIRVVLLDADGVVQLPPPDWRASLEAFCGVPGSTEDFLADLFAAEKPCLTGEADFEGALEGVLRRWGSAVPVADALRVWTQINPSSDMLQLVRALRMSGIVVALATNQQAQRADFMTTGLSYAEHFDELLYSCELGCAKPSEAYFTGALERLTVAPGQVLFIDDHEANVLAARACGLKAEVYHLSEGMDRMGEILKAHGVELEGC